MTNAPQSAVEGFLRQAVNLAARNVARGGRPFGTLVVKDAVIIATGVNEVDTTGDPTAHAELQAIRAAARALRSPRLDGCVVYASGHPCPMCLGAMYLTGVAAVYCALSLEAAEPYGLSTAHIYADLTRPAADRTLPIVCTPIAEAAAELYEAWTRRRSATENT